MKIKKLLCILFSLLFVLSCFTSGACAAEADASAGSRYVSALIAPSGEEYSKGEEICAELTVANVSSYVLGEPVTYIRYDGDRSFGPGVTEINYGSLYPGQSLNGSFRLTDTSGNGRATGLKKGFYRLYMFISRTFVIIREKFRSAGESFSAFLSLRKKEKLGSCTVVYDGKEITLTFFISFTRREKSVSGSTDVSFEPVSAQDMKISPAEKNACREWFEKNVVNAGPDGTVPAYNFTFGDRTLRDTLSDWTFTAVKRSEPYERYRNGRYSEISFSSGKYHLQGRVEAVLYEENATCEWTVYLKNTGTGKSKKISDFYAVDTAFRTGKNSLYANRGSSGCADDFTLFRSAEDGENRFTCRDGRSSDTFLPYFNVSGENAGICLAVGWSGQWCTVIDRGESSVSARVRQETLDAKLLPGEEIRSPLVSLTFYGGSNPVKGFNLFRRWVTDCLLDEDLPETLTNVDALYVSPTRTASDMTGDLNRIPPERFSSLDNIWMDAGWYCEGKGSIWDDRFGVWQSTENRFPQGVGEISRYGAQRGLGLVLWYEEERLSNVEESPLYTEAKKHKGWLLGEDNGKYTTGLVWNFGNGEALQFIRSYIGDSLKKAGATVFREDSNFDPLSYWKYGDRHINNNRSGITENHYVEAHYRFLDYLFEDNENLKLFDACASGGRRLDLEVIRRGVPMWRSDYNCDPHPDLVEATQSQTYGSSFWIPYTGTSCYTGSEYRVRSSLYQDFQLGIDQVCDTPTYEMIMKYKNERAAVSGNFYPVVFGGSAKDRLHGMQYGTDSSGFAVLYNRADVPEGTFTLHLSGLETDGTYRVYDADRPGEAKLLSGEQLMKDGINVPLGSGEEALLFEYELLK